MRTSPRFVCVALALLGLAQAPLAAALQAIADGPPQRAAFQRGVRQRFAEDNFTALDKMAADLWQQRTKSTDGVWMLNIFYESLALSSRQAAGNDESDFADYFARIGRWEKQFPDSPTAKIVHAGGLTKYAWKARGGGWADTVTPEGRKLFQQRLQQAHALLDSDPALKRWPGYYQVMQVVALGEEWPRSDHDKLFAAAVKLAPDYETFYFKTAYYLQPKWYGLTDTEWLEFAADSAKATEKDLGQAMYARIVWATIPAHWANAQKIRDAHLDWPRMRTGFEDLARQWPGSLWNKNAYCLYAWAMRDRPTARKLFAELDGRYSPLIWGTPLNFQRAESWARGADPAK